MNDILQLKGRLEQKGRGQKPRARNIPTGKSVNLQNIIRLREELVQIQKFWQNQTLKIKPLVSAHYKTVIAKSNRIQGFFSKGNESIVGAKFKEDNVKKHIITYCMKMDLLEESIKNVERAIIIFRTQFGNRIDYEQIKTINLREFDHLFKDKKRNPKGISRTKFVNIIVDSFYLEKFTIDQEQDDYTENAIITLFNTGTKTADIMKQLGINFLDVRSIDETTVLLTPEQYQLLKDKAPFLISMGLSDLAQMPKIEENDKEEIDKTRIFEIPDPGTEPTIGVIDTVFDESVYFSKWVKSKNMLDPNIIEAEDYEHGTQVTSIIVDGETLNPDMRDGCGRFQVRHFGVAKAGKFSSFAVLRAISEIISTNKDIKVWNLSLGSIMEVNSNFISPEAAILDKIQSENDVIFVVAGTNKQKGKVEQRMGAPADSINSIVVNSVDMDGKPVEYSRKGEVLSFFIKPDISYYGGSHQKGIHTFSPKGETIVRGTSFAAPWISRKLAYLIEVLGLSREAAKALLIDSAAGWEKKKFDPKLIGYGLVPMHIEHIIHSPKDEIKFIIDGISEKYDTYNYNIPVPEQNEKQPYISKATLCYFPKCSRNQGVDYTNTELDLHFGRVTKKKNSITVETIDNNRQSEEGFHSLKEEDVRGNYRKWDNVKHIREYLVTDKGNKRKAKQKRGSGLWGLSIKTKERLGAKDGVGLKFGLVVTLKELNGVNRIEEFIQQCQFKGWIVNRVDVKNRLDIYAKLEEDVEWK